MPKMRGIILRHGKMNSDGRVFSKKDVKGICERLTKRGYPVELDDNGNLVSNGMEIRDIKNELSVPHDG